LTGASYKGKKPYPPKITDLSVPILTNLKKKKIGPYIVIFFSLFFVPKKLISGQKDKKIKKNAFSTMVLEFFCQSKFSC
jgi:hypothetical protein